MIEQEIAGKRICLQNPQEFFALIKKSSKYHSWKELVEAVVSNNTSLKACRRGERTFGRKVFLRLLEYLTEEQQSYFLQKAVFIDENWGASKGGKQSVRNRKNKLGEEGFLELMARIRENSSNSDFSKWHNKMRAENPKLYSQIQRKRWLNLLKCWGSKQNRKKAIKSLKERYGENYFSLLGLNSASNQPLTRRETLVKEKISNVGFDIEYHKTISGFNFDFVYKKDNKIKAVEEVLGFRKKKGLLFFDILVLYEKYKVISQEYHIPFFLSTWYEVDLKYKVERFPLELLIWAAEKQMIPILLDAPFFWNLREKLLYGSKFGKAELVEFFKNNLGERKNNLKKGAAVQSKTPFDDLEQTLHRKLELMGGKPEGKKLIENRYGAFIVPDNYFYWNDDKIAVFVSKGDINGVIGSAALVKELVSPRIKTVGIVLSKNKRKLKTHAQNILLKSYVDYFYASLEEFEKSFVGP